VCAERRVTTLSAPRAPTGICKHLQLPCTARTLKYRAPLTLPYPLSLQGVDDFDLWMFLLDLIYHLLFEVFERRKSEIMRLWKSKCTERARGCVCVCRRTHRMASLWLLLPLLLTLNHSLDHAPVTYHERTTSFIRIRHVTRTNEAHEQVMAHTWHTHEWVASHSFKQFKAFRHAYKWATLFPARLCESVCGRGVTEDERRQELLMFTSVLWKNLGGSRTLLKI